MTEAPQDTVAVDRRPPSGVQLYEDLRTRQDETGDGACRSSLTPRRRAVADRDNELTALQAAQLANGQLLTRIAQLEQQLAQAKARARENADLYGEKAREVAQLRGTNAENKLRELQGKIESEQKRLDALVERKKAARDALSALEELATTFAHRVIEITDDIG